MSKMGEVAAGLRPYPESPGFKEPTTSRDAARAVAGDAETVREEVAAALGLAGERGMTPDETAKLLKRSVLSVRPRFTELAKAGRIVPTGARRENESGLKAKVWRIK